MFSVSSGSISSEISGRSANITRGTLSQFLSLIDTTIESSINCNKHYKKLFLLACVQHEKGFISVIKLLVVLAIDMHHSSIILIYHLAKLQLNSPSHYGITLSGYTCTCTCTVDGCL